MGAQDLSLFSLALLLVFCLPVFYINARLKLGVNRSLLTGLIRMGLQLGFVGLYLEVLFRLDDWLLNLAYLLVMICIACHAIVRSSNLKLRRLFVPVFFSILIPFLIILFFFNAFVARLENLFEAKYLISIGGMLLGNSLRSLIICLDRFYAGLAENEKTYLCCLSLFNNRFAALKPFFTESIRAAVTPIIASMATIGLVSLPGMMTGQILGGSIPMVAIKYQIAIMLSIFYTQYFASVLAIVFSLKAGLSAMGVLNRNIFKKPH